ncbi:MULTISPECIES: hypothetical protein [unclassified Francisella]|uniref:hypothetical protein n=1 Tax=unclassified Francisella TaxID=2610885 RepID=UPI002E3800B8|nr:MULTISPECIES: hypothetical protein [unclassified Francisella]MED7819871.1 hypothetical protein [Francisella sp. 19S2-4]MED7830711.1 hypothetical protein [Francisella sp. 19S2-10]
MNLKRRNYNSGVALVFAISVAIVFVVMGFLLFALVRSNFFIQKSQNQILEKKIHIQQVFKGSIVSGSQFFYNQNTIPSGSGVPEVKTFNNIQYSVKITNSDSSSGSISFMMPESGYTMRTRDYYVTMGLDNSEKNIVIKVPSTTQPSLDSGIDKSVISLNIPAIDFNELSGIQLNGNQDLTDKEVGYIGSLKVDSNNQELVFTNKNNEESSPLKLSGFESGTLSLSQGWELIDGLWNLSIGVFNPDTNEGCVIQTSLQEFEQNFSNLKCEALNKATDVATQLFAIYPNPQGYNKCIENGSYQEGSICSENGILFQALKKRKTTVNTLPFQDPTVWDVYYPTLDWVSPFTDGVIYQVGDQVVYDGRLFINTQMDQTLSPYDQNSGWEINGIYNFDDRVFYNRNDIVIFNNQFYEAIRDNQGSNDPSLDATNWSLIGGQYDSKSASLYIDYGIKFPYRLDLDVNNSEDLQYLRCTGEYPQINTNVYKQCINGQAYELGDMCYENNLLFTAQYSTTSSPSNNSSAWRLFIPSLEWVIPYVENVTYGSSITRVLFDGMVFVNNSWVSEGQTPYESGAWDIDGIYDWNVNVTYKAGDIVISGSNFYRAMLESKGVNPVTSGEWKDIGTIYEGKNADYYRSFCNDIVTSPTIVKGACDRLSCTVDITSGSTGGTGVYTYKIYDDVGNLLAITAGNSVVVNFAMAGTSYNIYAIAEDSDGVVSHSSNVINYEFESQLSKAPFIYSAPTGYGLVYNDKVLLESDLIVTSSGDSITFKCPGGYSFIKDAININSGKQITYSTYDGVSYPLRGGLILSDENGDSENSLVYMSSSVLYENNIKDSGRVGKVRYTNYYTRAICVPDSSDGHWNI